MIRTIKTSVLPKGESLFCVEATEVEIVDKAGGEFVKVRQYPDEEVCISIDPTEWDELKQAIDQAFEEIKKHEEKK